MSGVGTPWWVKHCTGLPTSTALRPLCSAIFVLWDVHWGLWLLALFGMGIGNFAILYNACLALSFFRIPRAGFMQANLVPRSAAAAFKVAVVTTILSVFIFPQLLAQLEPWASEIASHRKKVEKTITSVVDALPPVEQINGDVNCSGDSQIDADEHRCLYRQGTVEQIENARAEAASSVGAAADQLRGEVDAAFARLENEAVNEYLDWYYSLTGEYGRILMLLTGGTSRLEGYLTEKVGETFGRDQWFAGVNTGIERVFAADENARDGVRAGGARHTRPEPNRPTTRRGRSRID